MSDRLQDLAMLADALRLSRANRGISLRTRARLAGGQVVYAGTHDEEWAAEFGRLGFLTPSEPITGDGMRVKATPAGLDYFGQSVMLEPQ